MSWRQLGSAQHEELRRLLIERRRWAGLTQQQVAERVGRPQRFISRVERGLHRVTVVELIEFGQALEFDPARSPPAGGKGGEAVIGTAATAASAGQAGFSGSASAAKRAKGPR